MVLPSNNFILVIFKNFYIQEMTCSSSKIYKEKLMLSPETQAKNIFQIVGDFDAQHLQCDRVTKELKEVRTNPYVTKQTFIHCIIISSTFLESCSCITISNSYRFTAKIYLRVFTLFRII